MTDGSREVLAIADNAMNPWPFVLASRLAWTSQGPQTGPMGAGARKAGAKHLFLHEFRRTGLNPLLDGCSVETLTGSIRRDLSGWFESPTRRVFGRDANGHFDVAAVDRRV